MSANRIVLLIALLALPLAAPAQDAAPPPAEQDRFSDAPPPPPLLESDSDSFERQEPTVTIIQRDGETVEEYRIRDQLYMVRITPRVGPPYYLIDGDGDGNLESRRNELDPKLLVPAWVLFRF
jgi:hypothetical protein